LHGNQKQESIIVVVFFWDFFGVGEEEEGERG